MSILIEKTIPSNVSNSIANNSPSIGLNKNLKFYIQNSNKTSKKGYYNSSLQIYSNELYEINRKISQENIPLENLINEIEFLKKKYNVFKNKEKSNIYLTLLHLSNTILYKLEADRYQSISNDLSKNLVIANNNLNIKTKELEYYINKFNSKSFTIPEVNLVKNINIKQKYLTYIIQYGVPEDGIFLESLLDLIENT
jgi:hypothetical protein